MAMKIVYLAVDVGGTSVKMGWVDQHGRFIDEWHFVHESSGEVLLLRLEAEIQHALQQETRNQLVCRGIGLAIAGSVDESTGYILAGDNVQIYDVPLADRFTAKFGLPVQVKNDCEAAMLAEMTVINADLKREERVSDALFLTLGTGVGGGIWIHGSSFRGSHAQGAELGHIITHASGRACSCGNKGCAEQYLSATALHRSICSAKEQGADFTTIQELFEAHRAGDPQARMILEEYSHEFALLFVSLGAVFDPELLLIGGGLSYFESDLYPLFQKALDEQTSYQDYYNKTVFAFARLKNTAGMLGSVLGFIDDTGNP